VPRNKHADPAGISRAASGHSPSHDFAINSAWLAASLIAANLLAWLRLLALDGDLARADPKPCATRSCTPPRGWSAAGDGAG
jgi:hypothetical protein